MTEMNEHQRFRFEARLKLARAVGHTRAQEQKRIGDQIELLMFDAKTPEACEVLLALANIVYGERS